MSTLCTSRKRRSSGVDAGNGDLSPSAVPPVGVTSSATTALTHTTPWWEALESPPSNNVSVGHLQEIGLQIAKCLQDLRNDHGEEEDATEDHLSEVGRLPLAECVRAAALFTATCSVRCERDQLALLGTQDKLLWSLRAVLSLLSPTDHRFFREALLGLVAQSCFSRKRGNHRRHLVQALVESTEEGRMPPSAMLPILLAKETGPSASDVILDVLVKVAAGGSSGTVARDNRTIAVLEFLDHVVANMITVTTRKAGKSVAKAPPTHLTAFLMQACSSLPQHLLVFAKDLLELRQSGSSAARKLSLSILGLILEHGGKCLGARDKALAAVLHCARADCDAIVRSSAFDCAAEYVAREEGAIHEDELTEGAQCGERLRGAWVTDCVPRERPKTTREDCVGESTPSDQDDCVMSDHGMASKGSRPPSPIKSRIGHGEETNGRHLSNPTPMEATDADRRSSPIPENIAIGPWQPGGALLATLSTCAEAVLNDDSKTVRTKALACSLRVLQAHEGSGKAMAFGQESHNGLDPIGYQGNSCNWQTAQRALAAVTKGAFAIVESVAADNKGQRGLSASSASEANAGGKNLKAIVSARELLCLPFLDTSPIDVLQCYERCKSSRAAEATPARPLLEATGALQEVVRLKMCRSLDDFLEAVSAVMAVSEGDQEGRHHTSLGDKATGTSIASEESAQNSLMEALSELLGGVDPRTTENILRKTLDMFSATEVERASGATEETNGKGLSVLLRAIVLLGEGKGCGRARSTGRMTSASDGNGKDREHGHATLLAENETLFWKSLERRVPEIQPDAQRRQIRSDFEDATHGSKPIATPSVGHERLSDGAPDDERASNAANTASDSNLANIGDKPSGTTSAVMAVISETVELLSLFRLLADRSLLSRESSVALENLVFPAALSKRRLIRPAVALALVLEEPHRVLLSSLAVLQDAAFARSSTDTGRACDYVLLIGVLARENASFIAEHFRHEYDAFRTAKRPAAEIGTVDGAADDGVDYMAEVSSREAMEGEIRRVQEASVTSDGMLSCYTPFLLAIVRSRVSDARARETTATEVGGRDAVAGSPSLCPAALCGEALWALSQYAVLSPGLATTEVLPLAVELAEDAQQDPVIRHAAIRVLTRAELATDAIALGARALLGDPDPGIRWQVLARLGRLIHNNRIKAAHLSCFAAVLVDVDERVRQAGRDLFVEHFRPRPDAVCRCLFETYFILECKAEDKRSILVSLVAIAKQATPGQSLGSLGGALVRKMTEARTEQDALGAAFFLSLVPPTNKSLEAAEVALCRGQLAHVSHEVTSLVAVHFAKGHSRVRSPDEDATAPDHSGSRCDQSVTGGTLSKAQALEMAEKFRAITRRGGNVPQQRWKKGRRESNDAESIPETGDQVAGGAGGTSSSSHSERIEICSERKKKGATGRFGATGESSVGGKHSRGNSPDRGFPRPNSKRRGQRRKAQELGKHTGERPSRRCKVYKPRPYRVDPGSNVSGVATHGEAGISVSGEDERNAGTFGAHEEEGVV